MSGFVGAVYNIKNYNTGQPQNVYDLVTKTTNNYWALTLAAPDTDVMSANTMFNLVIPANAHYVITISLLNGLHTAGYQNVLELGR